MKNIEISVNEDYEERIDQYLAKKLDKLSRTHIQRLIKDSNVLVNGKSIKSRYMIKKGDLIKVGLPIIKDLELVGEDLPIEIIYEDEDIAIVNKPQGMVVHPAHGNESGTLVNALLFHIDNLSTINGDIRPGIVHRLDKDTSGLLIIAKNDYAHEKLVESFKDRNLKREYILLVHGVMKDYEGVIDFPIGRSQRDRKKMAVTDINSREAITNYRVLESFQKHTLVQANLVTGRTHQIRVHFSYINHPIVGDVIYSSYKSEFKLEGQLLHARKIGLIHPRTNLYMEFEKEIPERFGEIINFLK